MPDVRRGKNHLDASHSSRTSSRPPRGRLFCSLPFTCRFAGSRRSSAPHAPSISSVRRSPGYGPRCGSIPATRRGRLALPSPACSDGFGATALRHFRKRLGPPRKHSSRFVCPSLRASRLSSARAVSTGSRTPGRFHLGHSHSAALFRSERHHDRRSGRPTNRRAGLRAFALAFSDANTASMRRPRLTPACSGLATLAADARR
jgi:hypothetical protein